MLHTPVVLKCMLISFLGSQNICSFLEIKSSYFFSLPLLKGNLKKKKYLQKNYLSTNVNKIFIKILATSNIKVKEI